MKLVADNGVRMEYFKRYPNTKRASEWADKPVKIYSAEQGYFWRGTGQGYTQFAAASRTMTGAEAYDLVKSCGAKKGIWLVDANTPDGPNLKGYEL